ncbi:hypothetical protein EXIGLDRAFT_560176, partial [Exidia glandulosa HHB12029]
PKSVARKLKPRFIGPFKIIRVVVDGSTFELDLPTDLRARGINPTFHATLLRPFVPNDDARFPGRQLTQLPGFKQQSEDWNVIEITSHYGKGRELLFEVRWSTGHVTWERVREVRHLSAFNAYLEAMGV